MKALLCLLSEQHVPNLLAVHHFKPDQLVLIESEGMRRKGIAAHFLEAIKKGGLEYDSRHHVQHLSSEDDLAHIRAALQEVFDRFPSADWVANVTGGTKPMSIATYEFFKSHAGKVIYTTVGHPNEIIDLDTGGTESCGHKLTVEEFVTGYGFRPQKPLKELCEAKQRAEQKLWRETANIFAAQPAALNVLHLDDAEREKARKKGIEVPAERFQFPEQTLRDAWVGNATSRKLNKYEGEFLTGGWLEVFFYNVLCKYADQLRIWDVTLGHNISRGLGHDSVPNDIDVSFMHNHGMALVECKSGTQEHDVSRGMDTLYKIEAVARQLRALRVRSFLVTTAENVLDKQGKVRDALRSRAELYNCRILTREQIADLASLELQESPNSVITVKELFGL